MINTYENLLKLKNETENKELYVWGAKITGGAVCSVLLRAGFENVKYVIDSDPNTRGKKLYGFEIISPETFWEQCNKNDKKPYVIVAAAIRGREIFDICEAHGLVQEQDFCWADDILGPVYEMDLTNDCNLYCPSCPQTNYKKNTPARMDLNRFKRIIKHIKEDTPNVAYIPLFCWTEPFLRKDLHEFAAVLKEEQILHIVSTNFSLEIPNLVDYVKLKPEYFRISFSGFYQETYERAHRGGNINLVKSNMYKLRYLLDEYSPDTFVEIYFHEYNYTPDHEIEAWRKVCEELKYSFFNHNASINPIENQMKVMEGHDVEHLKPVLDTLKFSFNDRNFPNIADKPEICYSFKNMFYVTAEGKVIGCDCLYDEEDGLVAEDIETAKYEDMIKNKRKNKLCQNCLKLGLPMFNFALSSNPKIEKEE